MRGMIMGKDLDRILLVEDNYDIREITMIKLGMKGYKVMDYDCYDEVQTQGLENYFAYICDHNVLGVLNGPEWIKLYGCFIDKSKLIMVSANPQLYIDSGIEGHIIDKGDHNYFNKIIDTLEVIKQGNFGDE